MARKYRGAREMKPDAPHADLIALIKLWCEISGRGATAVCAEACGDDKLLWDLNGGRRIGTKMRADLLLYFTEQMNAIDAKLNVMQELLEAAMRPRAPQHAPAQTTA